MKKSPPEAKCGRATNCVKKAIGILEGPLQWPSEKCAKSYSARAEE
jgi:hypothetical protein